MAYDLLHIFNRIGLVPKNVLLVGAWEGGEVKGFLEAGVQRVYLFEAEPTAIQILDESYGKDPRVKLFEGAVTSEAGKLRKFHVLNHGSSSLLAPEFEYLKKILSSLQIQNEIQVNTITLDSSLRDYWGQWGDNRLETLLILDIQGGELDAIKGAQELLEKVGWIQTEVSTVELYKDQNTLAQLDYYMNAKGFQRVSTRIYTERNHGDALYFRLGLVNRFFLAAMWVEDLHWNLARVRPTWIPSLNNSKIGKLILRLIYGKKGTLGT
jgi:FkbM family methyltransferase